MLATSGVLFAILSEWDVVLADALYVAMTLGGLAIVLPILWRAASLRSNYLGLFAAAWAAPILFAFARLLAALHALPNATWLDSSTVFSMALEALISSIAIAYRMRIISRERDTARESEVVARALADTDPLTGLLNRRSFLAHAVGGETRTLHVIDIDHFKQVNETIGHDGGDDVLCLVARTLREVAPAGALVARIGGEEFAPHPHAL
jgi:GGDEF domain-containing protein